MHCTASGDHSEDVAAELAERRAHRLVQALQVVVDLDSRHQLAPGFRRSWSMTITVSLVFLVG
jgi:hypothetical protein